jgi:hypothetical protein
MATSPPNVSARHPAPTVQTLNRYPADVLQIIGKMPMPLAPSNFPA